MKIDQAKFLAGLPPFFDQIYSVLRAHGFIPTLVGGTVRDFLLSSSLGLDWDFELTHPVMVFNKSSWKDLARDLSPLGKITFLPYEVMRLQIKNYQFEFSPPRREIFKENWESSGHSNFEAEFDLQLDFAGAIQRRDFTVNAIGIRFHSLKQLELLDPSGGVIHLRANLLHPVGPDFEKDPIRFLRAIRFAIKMNLTFSLELENKLQTMRVTPITSNYFWNELLKSTDPLKMLSQLANWQKVRPELVLPVQTNEMAGKWDDLKSILIDPFQHECWIIALAWIGIKTNPWFHFFKLSSQTSQRLSRWAQSSRKFQTILPEFFHGEFEQICQLSEFDLIFDWYFTTKQLLQKNPALPLLKMIEKYLPHWIYLYQFEVLKDVKHMAPASRAKYQVWNLCQRL